MTENLYTNGQYLEQHPTWHTEDSAWKAGQILRMLARQRLAPQTVCEVGCGAGEILRQLQLQMDETCTFRGYEISPQAFALCQPKANPKLNFKLQDILDEKEQHFDLMLMIDVIEHLEDYFSFLRRVRPMSQFKILHIPLELSLLNLLTNHSLLNSRKVNGHLHHFTRDLALQVLKDTGYEIVDFFYTPSFRGTPGADLRPRLLKAPRQILFGIHPDWAARLVGGCSLMVLAK